MFTDSRNEKVGAKIRDSELKKIPVMMIVGEKEEKDRTVSIRRRHAGDLGAQPVDKFVAGLVEEIKTRRRALA